MRFMPARASPRSVGLEIVLFFCVFLLIQHVKRIIAHRARSIVDRMSVNVKGYQTPARDLAVRCARWAGV
jgi:hypothetical protein